MHTEAEARERRCCGPAGCGYDRPSNTGIRDPHGQRIVTTDRYCIASQCMAWRVGKVTTHQTGMTKAVRDGRETRLMPATEEVIRGYCGLAGDPWPPLLKVETGAAS